MGYAQLQLRGDTAANWNAANPVLADREMAIETDTRQFKVGDGATAWNALPYGGVEGPEGPEGPTYTAGSGIRIAGTTLSAGGAAVVDITGSTTLSLAHADRFIRCNSATAMTITVPAQATVPWPNDIQLEGAQWGTGAVTFVGASGVTIRRSSKITATTDGQYAPWGLKRTGLNEWLLFGQMGSA